MAIEVETNLDYLIDSLRLHLGDTDESSYRYTDEWLRTSLVGAVKTLQRWWNYKYLVNNTTYNVSRNSRIKFLFPSPPIVEHGDEEIIVLMASIIIKRGSLEANSWNVGSWKDWEVSYSNIEGNKAKIESLEDDWDALTDLIKPPTKRLAQSVVGRLPGFKDNPFDRNPQNAK